MSYLSKKIAALSSIRDCLEEQLVYWDNSPEDHNKDFKHKLWGILDQLDKALFNVYDKDKK
jgi:hypothetical protein